MHKAMLVCCICRGTAWMEVRLGFYGETETGAQGSRGKLRLLPAVPNTK